MSPMGVKRKILMLVMLDREKKKKNNFGDILRTVMMLDTFFWIGDCIIGIAAVMF